MGFLSYFTKTLAIILAITTFIIIISTFINLTNLNEENFFKLVEGKKDSKNVIAILEINGAIIDGTHNNLRINVNSFIFPEIINDKLANLKNYNPKILIVKINSPGGTVSASSQLHKFFEDYKKNNNVKLIFFTNQLLTSGGYWVATAGDNIFASYGSIIGSIGVSGPNWFFYNKPTSISNGLFGQSIDTQKGIEVFSQNSGLSKDLYNPFRKPSIEEMNHLQSISDQIYSDFINQVSKSRKIEESFIKNQIGAQIFNTKQAKYNYLIDDEIYFADLIKSLIKENKYFEYKIIKNNQNKKFIDNFFSNNSETTLDICKFLISNYISMLPLHLDKC